MSGVTNLGRVDDQAFALRLGEIKPTMLHELEDRWSELLTNEIIRKFGNPVVCDENDLMLAWDRFFLQYHLPDGRTPVQVYADEHSELSAEERTTLKGWSEVIESLFEISRVSGQEIYLKDLLTNRDLLVRPNLIMKGNPFRVGQLVVTRLVPVRDFYTFSGSQQVVQPGNRRAVIRGLQNSGVKLVGLGSSRWRPTQENPAPAPKAPCPCGSGRRYRKCCMSR